MPAILLLSTMLFCEEMAVELGAVPLDAKNPNRKDCRPPVDENLEDARGNRAGAMRDENMRWMRIF